MKARILKMRIERKKDGAFETTKVGARITDVRAVGNAIAIAFEYRANYEPGVAELEIVGELFDEYDSEYAREVEETWRKKRSMPLELLKRALNAISYVCTNNAPFVSFALLLPPPMGVRKPNVRRVSS